jgi:hypothetical protein
VPCTDACARSLGARRTWKSVTAGAVAVVKAYRWAAEIRRPSAVADAVPTTMRYCSSVRHRRSGAIVSAV